MRISRHSICESFCNGTERSSVLYSVLLQKLWVLPLIFSFLCCFDVLADDWPMYLGDLGHTSYAASETYLNPANVGSLAPLWQINVGAPIVAGVTTANGSLYFGAWNGYFYSLDAGSGAIAWKTFVGLAAPPPNPDCQRAVGVTSQAVVSSDTIYVGGGDSAVYALDRATGAIKWKNALSDPQSGSYLWPSI